MKIFFVILPVLICFMFIGYFLDVSQKPKKSDIIVCLSGGDDERILKSFFLLKNNFSNTDKILIPNTKKRFVYSFMHTNNKKLIENLKQNTSVEYSWKKDPSEDNTMKELVLLNKYILENKLKSVLIVTDPPHSRRVKLLINNYVKIKNVSYTIVSSSPLWWNKYFYYTNFHALVFSFSELVRIAYNVVLYEGFINTTIYKKMQPILKTVKKNFSSLVYY